MNEDGIPLLDKNGHPLETVQIEPIPEPDDEWLNHIRAEREHIMRLVMKSFAIPGAFLTGTS